MTGPRHGQAAAGVAAIAALLGVMSAPGCEPLYGCDERENRFGYRLDALPVLELHPPGATLEDEYSGCDDDDLYATAGRKYHTTGTAAETKAFYRHALPAAGWRLDTHLLAKTNRMCFTKSVDGTAAIFALEWLSEEPQNFYANVKASLRDTLTCADDA
ncbi:hypothetical protein [Actinopolymorpha rutila]|uniref:Uncharacterized protein n=1 Tax=Actinopolymorpha rutila TaxID=446787 RepID=A0A852ZID9_9ACTN|nr:hypothetical protein [Actinopolymorpha rutila]NYH92827.1 hypothetical protein [Actinopolymorpha rutila]